MYEKLIQKLNIFLPMSHQLQFKLLIIGDSGVGKTCILLQFADNKFDDIHISTIGLDFKVKNLEIDGKNVKLQLWDTAGQERYRSIASCYYREAAGIILAYDITARDTFASLTKWIEDIRKNSQDVPIMLVGNKSDLESKRKVSYAEGQEISNKYELLFMETSAKDNSNIEKAFVTLTRLLISGKKPQTQTQAQNQIQITEQSGKKKNCCK